MRSAITSRYARLWTQSGLVGISREVGTMPRMSRSKTGRRTRRQFSEEFKEAAIRLVLYEGTSVGAVARAWI